MSFFFPGRLAWRQLVFDRTKLIAAISGVLFATVLVFMQIGFRDSLYASAASAPTRMDGDLFLVHKQSEAMWRPIHFTRTELMRSLAHSQVAEVQPLYMGLAPFKNPSTQSKRTLMVYGYDPKANIFNAPEIISQQQLLTLKDNVIFDESSRPEFGPIRQLRSEGKDTTEINDYKVKIVGFFRLVASFAADVNIVT
ncbi:MAG: DevC protein, partial [Methylococcaceae bacterium]|nr:DevC protein [Methylococcaceae bacterium]